MTRRPERSHTHQSSQGKFDPARIDVFAQWLLPRAVQLVPRPRRADWQREWQAELWHFRNQSTHPASARSCLTATISLSYGLLADAAWLRSDQWKENARGSAASCLAALFLYCLLCILVERVYAGSWHSFGALIASHFLGGFIFIALPAIFAAFATYPLRPLRCDHRHSSNEGFLSTRTRWNLFLSVKILLTLALGFFATIAITAPVRLVIGPLTDWIELLLWAFAVTFGLRWALLNQERRCQRCLRILSQPTRVGVPSHNFLEWNGTELACSDGHGHLHVPEMQGSWCWYDRWVELDPSWAGLFSA